MEAPKELNPTFKSTRKIKLIVNMFVNRIFQLVRDFL